MNQKNNNAKKKDLITVFLYVFIVICFCGAGYFGYRIFIAEKEYKEGEDIYENIAKAAKIRVDNQELPDSTLEPTAISATSTPMPLPVSELFANQAEKSLETVWMEDNKEIVTPFFTPEKTETAEYMTPTPTIVSTIIPTFTPVPTEESVVTEEPKSKMDFTELLDINDEVVGWITLQDSKVNYPIMHGEDNDFYLHHAITGEWNKVGCPYMDFRNRGDFTDRISVVYGHYMENGTMFTDFHKFKGQKYYEEHKTADLYTPNGDFTVEFVAGVIKNVEDWDFTFEFESNEEFVHYLTNFKLVSTFKSDVEIDADSKYVFFSLCTYDVENGRYLLLGKLTTPEK